MSEKKLVMSRVTVIKTLKQKQVTVTSWSIVAVIYSNPNQDTRACSLRIDVPFTWVNRIARKNNEQDYESTLILRASCPFETLVRKLIILLYIYLKFMYDLFYVKRQPLAIETGIVLWLCSNNIVRFEYFTHEPKLLCSCFPCCNSSYKLPNEPQDR